MIERKALDNNDLSQVGVQPGFSENKGFGGVSVSRAHKTWSRSLLLCSKYENATPNLF